MTYNALVLSRHDGEKGSVVLSAGLDDAATRKASCVASWGHIGRIVQREDVSALKGFDGFALTEGPEELVESAERDAMTTRARRSVTTNTSVSV